MSKEAKSYTKASRGPKVEDIEVATFAPSEKKIAHFSSKKVQITINKSPILHRLYPFGFTRFFDLVFSIFTQKVRKSVYSVQNHS